MAVANHVLLVRQIIDLAQHSHSCIMLRLAEQASYKGLRLNFEPCITLAAQGISQGELAKQLQISKQSCTQLVKQVEEQGFVKRYADSNDARIKNISLTAKGDRLFKDGINLATAFADESAAIVGAERLDEFCRAMATLALHFKLPATPEISIKHFDRNFLCLLLARLNEYCHHELMRLTIELGHPNLKPSYGSVMIKVTDRGSRIQDIANANNVSKQAISATAKELIKLDYLSFEADPMNARTQLLVLTDFGRQLIKDSTKSLGLILKSFEKIIGKDNLLLLSEVADELHNALDLANDINEDELQALATQLRQKYSKQDIAMLCKLLKG